MVLADGFYEWDKQKHPYRFVSKSGEPFAMAGIYARSEHEMIQCTFAIHLTNSLAIVLAEIRDRLEVRR